ncbi:MAG TPA: ATP-binding protein [Pyrinomonadaceae bacterium]|nr:ATP-binding protein [Pyrinomonadaceae bacterium]
MNNKPKQRTREGQVVYRRIGPAAPSRATDPKEPRLDPALWPLVAGFALLLLLILVLGNLSVRKIEDTSSQALVSAESLGARNKIQQDLRVALTKLDNEVRMRMEAVARREIRPPLAVRLDTARNEVADFLPQLDRLALTDLPKWRKFRDDLAAYIEITRSRDRYVREGYTSFRDLNVQLNDIGNDLVKEQTQIVQSAEALQVSATRTIRLWNIFALLAGLAVAMATAWQAQRRFQQTRHSTEAARREREFSNQILEGMVSAIAAIDRQDRIRSANTAFMRIFPRAVMGSSIHDQIASPEAVKLLEAATASHVVTSTYRGRWNLNQDEGLVHYDVYSSPLEIDGERGQILTLVDVTDAAKAEAALRRSESLAAVGSAAAQLAHEIKNPLGSIRLGVEMLRQYTSSDEAEKTISLVERGIHHLNKLVVDVTQFSRRRELELTPADLRDVIESSIELVADRVREKNTPIETRFQSPPIHGYWDTEQLREVFMNLLANAIDASQPRSPVEISVDLVGDEGGHQFDARLFPNGERARIAITDHGSGMDQKAQSRLFEPFFTTKKRGTGLGLSIVRQIIDLHGGNIEVKSEPRKGTTFQIELPLGLVNSEQSAANTQS